MTTVYDVPADMLIDGVKEELKNDKNITPPQWATFVKTGSSREKVPDQNDWWYIRAASIMRKVYVYGPVGVETLRVNYGSKKNRGVKPEKFTKSSGAIIRKIFTQLEKGGYITKAENGRIMSPQGMSLLDKKASEIKSKIEADIPELKKYY
ncbi:MAG: 30S ribosomal protein S19e [Candidatus Methanofastidiosum sp.]|nr:30S ribosomal protein S19e [Methanofastidiosum sp.]